MSILKLLASDGFLSVNKHIAQIVGLDAAVLLAELASSYNFFEAIEQLTPDGMFFETVERIQVNTTLSQYQQAKAVKVLSDAGILETKKVGIPAKRYFRINEDVLIGILNHKSSKNLITGDEKTSSLDVKKLDCNNNRENNKQNNKVYRFVPPTIEEVAAYCRERNNGIDAEQFVDFYSSKGWKVGNNKMQDWKAAVRTWERRRKQTGTGYKKQTKAEELDGFYAMANEWAKG